ncbi:MAG: biotin/lipoyl-containing protein, partial [Lysobacterales bacterium]
MANMIEVKVPDIGNFKGVPVIEILVKPGDVVARDQGLVTLESDKATMEVPSSVAGVVKEIRVKLNDVVAEGAVVAVIETQGAAAVPSPAERGKVPQAEGGSSSGGAATQDQKEPPSPLRAASPDSGGSESQAPRRAADSTRKPDLECQVVVLGSG